MIVYGVHYLYQQQTAAEYFDKEQKARARFAQLYRDQRAGDEVTELRVERDEIMRPGVETVLRILNGEPYVIKRETVLASDYNKNGDKP